MNYTGHGIPVAGWPNGSGFTHYKWRLETNAWSVETPINTPISITGLADGPHYVEVVGQNDAGWYQDDPAFGPDAVVTRSPTWTVQTSLPLKFLSITHRGVDTTLRFEVSVGHSYTVQYSDVLYPISWQKLQDVPVQPADGIFEVTDFGASGDDRFYRVVSPAQP